MNANLRTIPGQLLELAMSLERHLITEILPFWPRTMDRKHGGFAGLVRNDGSIDLDHPKGVVMHSRHLWTYSQAWLHYHNPRDLEIAQHAYQFLTTRLHDPIGNGFWWTVDAQAKPEFENKVLYGQAFAIYGLAAYFTATKEKAAIDLAMATFGLMEKTGRDNELDGYYEAVDRHWTRPLAQALSPVDISCDKSMNTNLHVLEAYSALFLATGSPRVHEALAALLETFEQRILVSPQHLGLYFDREWHNLTSQISYGHNIEASWLMTEAAGILWGHKIPQSKKNRYATIARATLALINNHGGSLPDGIHDGIVDTNRIWWVQAEAIVGMVKAWELTGDIAFLQAAGAVWSHIENHMIDREHGEWFWSVDAAGKPDLDRPKGGLWKTSYHNGRACLEVIQRAGLFKSSKSGKKESV